MEDQENIMDKELYKSLQALSDLSFPKVCPTCNQRFETVEEFIAKTEALRKSTGLKSDVDDEGRTIVELFRNCTCGSTLMDEFNDRRNLSPAGIRRREKFGELVQRLCKNGYPAETVRRELLKIMRGEGSDLLKVVPGGGAR